MHPDLQRWSALGSVQDEQMYYSLALEEQVLQRENLTIYMCKKQWCARMLLSQAFKATRASMTRADAVAATVDADDDAAF
ncbi:hypothetical protein MAM1_0175d07266 [Mucor ambiguus]|uniref:Uncharacterized protein n=1 Tax=Mucor ambiguus TaxID=91626 RepID=A0A0C9MZR6_9FUNG|nr:hypothetical protein MAM1_0175d07266 [Mucor ambiguus]